MSGILEGVTICSIIVCCFGCSVCKDDDPKQRKFGSRSNSVYPHDFRKMTSQEIDMYNMHLSTYCNSSSER